MNDFQRTIELRWSDLDPNFHLRHSVYYDFGAAQRVAILEAHDLTLAYMKEHHLGPILFREECLFRREIRLGDEVIISSRLSKLKADATRWSIRHEFLRGDKKLLATLNVDGSWMNTIERKLASPLPQKVVEVFHAFPRTDDFVSIP